MLSQRHVAGFDGRLLTDLVLFLDFVAEAPCSSLVAALGTTPLTSHFLTRPTSLRGSHSAMAATVLWKLFIAVRWPRSLMAVRSPSQASHRKCDSQTCLPRGTLILRNFMLFPDCRISHVSIEYLVDRASLYSCTPLSICIPPRPCAASRLARHRCTAWCQPCLSRGDTRTRALRITFYSCNVFFWTSHTNSSLDSSISNFLTLT